MQKRVFDIVIWGATGFTGRLCAEHLAKNGPSELKWAIGGRRKDALQNVINEFVAPYVQNRTDGMKMPEILIGNLEDPSSLESLTKQTTVLLTTAGPFTKLGMPIVDACVKTGTHYVDSTGEYSFVKEVIDKYHEECSKKKIILVPCCGCDSIPSDLGVFSAVKHLQKKCSIDPEKVSYFMQGHAGISGGTIKSIVEIVSGAKDLSTAAQDQLYFVPKEARSKLAKPERTPIFYQPKEYRSDRFAVPWMMESINVKVVQRTNYLLGQKNSKPNGEYGKNFKYSERMIIKGRFNALFVTFTLVFFTFAALLLKLPGVAWFVRKYLFSRIPEGPNRDYMENKAHYEIKVIANSVDQSNKERRVDFIFANNKDIGYMDTSKMLCESALCLVFDREQLSKKYNCIDGGVLTPAAAFGDRLRERLSKFIKISVEEV